MLGSEEQLKAHIAELKSFYTFSLFFGLFIM